MTAGEGFLSAMKARHTEVAASRPVFEPQSRVWLRLCEAEHCRLRGERGSGCLGRGGGGVGHPWTALSRGLRALAGGRSAPRLAW